MNTINHNLYHIGVIPDGNRRWAEINGKPGVEGHTRGSKKMELFLNWALNKPQIKEVSVYGLSEENFKRSSKELNWLYDIYYKGLNRLLKDKVIHDKQIRVNFVSTKADKVPKNIIDVVKELKTETKVYGNKVLNILIGYTGQSEILKSVSSPINRIKNLFFGLKPSDLERQLLVKNPCDFVIRTGEEESPREAKSGFLLWQSAYSEYYHINKYWPDVQIKDLNKAWKYFLHTRRKKGK